MILVAASELAPDELRELFNRGFSDYLVPLQLGEDAFREHLAVNDVDLEASFAARDPEPAALALIARRGRAAWVAGMGTAPAYRRRGLGEEALRAGLAAAAARGCDEVWLEVIDRNLAAVALYAKLGFERVRDVVVWSRPPARDEAGAGHRVAPEEAQAWIAGHRRGREPWQRSDAAVAKVRGPLAGAVVESDGERTAAALFTDGREQVTVLQIAARDESAARDVLRAAAGAGRILRLANVPADDPASRALEELGANVVARQHEMRLAL